MSSFDHFKSVSDNYLTGKEVIDTHIGNIEQVRAFLESYSWHKNLVLIAATSNCEGCYILLMDAKSDLELEKKASVVIVTDDDLAKATLARETQVEFPIIVSKDISKVLLAFGRPYVVLIDRLSRRVVKEGVFLSTKSIG